jgi:hypothetical protein
MFGTMNIIKKVYNWFHKDMEPDPEKIKATISKLKSDTGDDWSETVGFYVVQSADLEGTSAKINLNSGMVQKAFINPKTGEVKYFWIDKIKKD